jgi:SAM-dependent methyltransferase
MESAQSKNLELFNKVASDYAKKDIVPSTALVRKHRLITCLDSLPSTKKSFGTILEIGCGVGAPSWHLEGYYDRYVGVDYSEKLIEQAELQKRNDKVTFIVADLLNLNIDLKADLIFADGVLHHITDLDILMKSLKSVVMPGAYFVAREPHRTNPIVRFLRWIRKKVDASYSEEQHFFKPSELVDLLKRNDFEDISCKFIGFFSTPFGEVILKPHWLFLRISKLMVLIDSFLEAILPHFLKSMSWDVVVRAKFPQV